MSDADPDGVPAEASLPRRAASSEVHAKLPLIYEDETVRITGIEAGTAALFVAFTGIGHRFGAVEPEEFVGTAYGGGKNSVLFVHDKGRTWFNAPSITDAIRKQVALWSSRCDKVVTIGNSMGAFGAMVFASKLNAPVAIAFGPQFSVSPDVVVEKRWQRFTSNIKSFTYLTAQDEISDDCSYFLFHGDAGKDERQIAAFAFHPNHHQFIIRQAGHNVASLFKRRGDLSRIVDLCVARDVDSLRRFLADSYDAILREPDNDPYAAGKPMQHSGPKLTERSEIEMMRKQFRRSLPKAERKRGETEEERARQRAAVDEAFTRSMKDGTLTGILAAAAERQRATETRMADREARQAARAAREKARLPSQADRGPETPSSSGADGE